MRSIGLIAIVVGAALFGYLAWYWTTSRMHYRSANSSIRPQQVRPEAYEEWVIGRRKRWRLVKTAAALVGAAIGWILFITIGSGLAQQ
jgi:hypothetical protein